MNAVISDSKHRLHEASLSSAVAAHIWSLLTLSCFHQHRPACCQAVPRTCRHTQSLVASAHQYTPRNIRDNEICLPKFGYVTVIFWNYNMTHQRAPIARSVVVHATWLQWSASLGSRPRLAGSFVSGYSGVCFEIKFSGRHRGFDSVLFKLWPFANTGFRGTQGALQERSVNRAVS